MKKILILFALTLSMSAFSQFNTKSIYFSGMTGGSTGLEIRNEDFIGTSGFIPINLKVEGGYFIKNKIALGGDVSISDLNLSLWGENQNYYYQVLFGPTIRYYMPKADDVPQPYLFGYGFYGFEPNHNLYGIQLGYGVNYFFNEAISLDARVSYTYKHTFNREFGGSHNNHRFLFEIGISVFFPSINFFDRS
jgi:hypothetical protein